jgi:hypothetical protein
MVFNGFSKKIRNKTFYFHSKIFTLFFFFLVLALESISGVKSRLSGQISLNIIFSQKLSNYHISLWRKVFFSICNQFLPASQDAGNRIGPDDFVFLFVTFLKYVEHYISSSTSITETPIWDPNWGP